MIERALIECLSLAAPRLVPGDALVRHARETVFPLPSSTEIETARERLEALRYLVSVRDEVTGKLRYGLTDSGKAWLADHR